MKNSVLVDLETAIEGFKDYLVDCLEDESTFTEDDVMYINLLFGLDFEDCPHCRFNLANILGLVTAEA